MLPGTARRCIGIQYDMAESESRKVIGRRQTGLAGADDDRVEDLHIPENTGPASGIARRAVSLTTHHRVGQP